MLPTTSTIAVLNLEASRPSTATGFLELPSLAHHLGLLVRVGPEAEVLHGFASVLGSTEEERVGTSGGALNVS